MNNLRNAPVVLLCLLAVLLAASSEAALTLEDCQKCHTLEHEQIAAHGLGHKTQVTCIDCHESHRPLTADNIPACQACHEQNPHEKMTDCSSCHPRKEACTHCHNPHQPLARTDGETAQVHCKTCHPTAVELMSASASKHRDLGCHYCHTFHREMQSCSGCHGTPHPEGTHKLFPECILCHGAGHNLNPM